jgi:hypothetical protein
MSQSVNKVILARFLGAGPELKFTAQGKARPWQPLAWP